jgi:acyl transferase domain-containing protein/acyl carrier protein/NAD(P)-dependent dehydrogenase (short-subunit alcohol dehydrogenase family)/1,4-dihydroxy-2-naphthoyl-CoA synthase
VLTRGPGSEPIAIIGVGLRLPQADSLDGFWAHLAAGRSLITEVPAQRWDAAELRGDPRKGNKTNSIWGAFLENADCFDAAFFNISPREAAWMDPQQRFAMELAWSAVEDAGYRAGALAGSRTGVYVGVCHWDYAELLEKYLAHVDAYTPTGIAFSVIANRISHFFDFRGPSIANDTACAASMTSVYEAVRALQAGECDLALAGGVNLIWSPNHFIAFSKSGMLSKDGRSKAFDQRADGYVRGEGGAMLLLKPLAQAHADRDPIHAVIRGIGTNHGGRTNSLTVTNPKAQAELIAGVYREAGVTPDSVSYIEAHGPGTPLGDPIEITGLKTAFDTLYREAGGTPEPCSCGIGSVKTNIGHLEGAAGVAGIVKVLAAMRHSALPANVDFTELNSLIDLAGSPFRIQSELTAWPRQAGRPRRAGVSSFGFGGSNAHVLIEDDAGEQDAGQAAGGGALVFPLSARDDERLAAYVNRLLEFLESGSDGGALEDLAYTLQVGREAMAERVAFVVEDRGSLIAALTAYRAAMPDVRVRRQGDRERLDDDRWRAADLWVDGHHVDWPPFYSGDRRRRIHAVTYPFARERHWMDESIGAKNPEAVLHPLLHRNVSRFDRQCYLSKFTGREFFWADHRVGDAQVLPGVAFLEMARAADEQAAGGGWPDGSSLQFENVVWTRPIRAGVAPVPVEIRLRRLGDGRTAFEMEGTGGASRGVADVQGVIARSPVSGPRLPSLDIEALRTLAHTTIDSAECYRRLRSTGVHHGPAFQAIGKLHCGDGFVLANLRLPRQLENTIETCPLHPILLDAAIQAWIGFESEAGALPGAAVPFACRMFSAYGPCERAMWAVLRPTSDTGSGLKKFDIDLCDRHGGIRARFTDLALRTMVDAGEAEAVTYCSGQWERWPMEPGPSRSDRRTTVLLAGFEQDLRTVVAERTGFEVVALDLAGGADPAGVVSHRFGVLGDRLRTAPTSRQQILVFVPDAEPAHLASPLAALLKTAAIEQPDIEGSVVRISGAADANRVARIAREEHRRADAFCEIRYDADDGREVWRPVVTDVPAGDSAIPVRAEAAYWITGGLGKLGMHFAEWLASKGATRIVLSGRREAAGGAALERLNERFGERVSVHYVCCDMGRRDDVVRTAAWIAAEVGPLKGVIHAAGRLRDGYILNKDRAAIDAVFAPKVSGTIHLDEATRALPLEFLVLCSSVAAVFGSAGQADYSGANAFMDAFAEHRAALVARGERWGTTVSIAWPLWADGGMKVDAPTLAAMHRRVGTVPLATDAALRVLDRILGMEGGARVAVHCGDRRKFAEFLLHFGEGEPIHERPVAVGPEPASARGRDLLARTIEFLKDALAESTQMDAAKIKSNRKLEEYGLDSIVIVELTNRLEEKLGTLSKTLFFEYVDLDGVAAYLVERHGNALEAALPAVESENSPHVEPPEAIPADRPGFVPLARVSDRHDVAIVGLSIRVSKAADQEAFWELLAAGQHGFEKYPESRWNHAALLHPERDVLGKTVVQTGAFLDGVDEFDPRYFRISQYEAELMSPEVRLFLQASVEALEDAGYSREYLQTRYGGDVAVIVGSMTNEYDLFGFENMLLRGSLASGSYTGTIPNMVSYYYGFTGPSYFLDTMCSGSSTCVHEAVHMLRSGRCRMAVAGGVSLLLHPHKLIAVSQEHFTTKTAEVIRGYGLGADGTILGEGVGALVLKTLVDAERDGDHIYAVIKGTGVSNAGVRNGFTVPNPNQQAAAIEQAIADAGIDPRTIGYVEGHGSGTSLGDPIEIKALTAAYRKYTRDVQFCPIGTVKSNIAHLLAAAGLAGIAKVLMQMKHGKLAPSLHAPTLNPNIPFAETPFYVQREPADWPRRRDGSRREIPRRAGVTSIGAGGMNSHIILEEYVPLPVGPRPGGSELFVFSAMTEVALLASIERFREHLAKHPELDLSDVAYTLQAGKNELSCRLAFVAANREELMKRLDAFVSAPVPGAGWSYIRNILDKDPRVDREQLAEDTRRRRLDRIAALWADGVAIDWDALHAERQPRRVSLPGYPFDRVRCWYSGDPDAPSVVHPLGAAQKLHPFIGANRSDLHGLRYVTSIQLNELLDYVFKKDKAPCVLPTVVADVIAAAARIAGLEGPLMVRDLKVLGAITWSEVAELECTVEPRSGGLHIVLETRNTGGQRQPFAQGFVAGEQPPEQPLVTVELLRTAATRTWDHRAFYGALAGYGLSFGPYLDVVDRAWTQADGGMLCEIRSTVPQQDFFKRNVQLPAYLLGAAYQALVLMGGTETALAGMGNVWIGNGQATLMLLRVGQAGHDILFLDENGRVLGALAGVLTVGPGALTAQSSVVAEGAPKAKSEGPLLELCELAAQVLKFSADEINVKAPFYDLGFDSISLTRLANDINARFGSTLTPAVFFECEHIEALSKHLASRHGAPLRASTRVEEPHAAPVSESGRIAIIGMAARLPGADNPNAFFDRLLAGHDMLTALPLERYSGRYRDRFAAASFAKRGGFLADIDRFDAAFFHISPVEAERMDPQQRLMLETVWHALADAGYRPDELPDDTGVFVGVTGHDYASLLQAYGIEQDGFAATGNSLAMVANRISHHLDVHGPSQAVDTACSSSLIALLRAADAIRSGRCHMAIVGGVNLALSLEGFEGPHQAGMLSPDGCSKTFSDSANGYVRGEGVVALLLKPLADAEREGDRILGLLAGGAENHGGRSGSLTAPNAKAQAALVECAMTGIDPASIGYIEAHGTGTSLGDPVEVNGLRLAYRALLEGREVAAPAIGLGSVKSNIGHLEAAAGLAGVVKVLMALKRGELPPTLHCEHVNPYIELQGTPFYLVRARKSWPRRLDSSGRELPRRAAVSSFGFGGTNAHMVFEEYVSEMAPRRRPLEPPAFADARYWIPGARDSACGAAQTKVLLTPHWVEAQRDAGSAGRFAVHLILACEMAAPAFAVPGAHVLEAPTLAGDIGTRYQALAVYLLEVLQQQLRMPDRGRVLVQLVVPLGDEREVYEGLGAMLDTACAESPRIVGQVIGVPAGVAAGELGRILADEALHPAQRRVRHWDGTRRIRAWSELPPASPAGTASHWRVGGVYLITGGMGALGRLVASDIARRAPGASLIVAGSSPLDASRQAFLDELRALGARASYRRADAGDMEAVAALVRETVTKHGALHGVVHCAGIHRDSYIIRKNTEELRAVLAPKVAGAVALDQACRGLTLDWLVFFSSLGGAVGNPGQADYAAANGFLDSLSAHRGHPMIAIDWPLWQDGGMKVDPETERALFNRMGQVPLETADALDALHAVLTSRARQVAVVAGEPARIRAFFAAEPRQSIETVAAPVASGGTDGDLLLDRTMGRLRLMFGRMTGIRPELLDANQQLDHYGIDSLLITRLNRELDQVFGALPKTLFFEHRTLVAVARRLVDEHADACRGWTESSRPVEPEVRIAAQPAPDIRTPAARAAAQEPIAIIGISGRYPGAPDLDTFWANLAAGKDCIGEVPAERWSLDGFYLSDPVEAVERGSSYSKWGGFLDGFADFDPLFFRISPRDAMAMDPQERLFLMTAWSACQDAGYTRSRLAARHGSRVGVFVGITKTGFALHGIQRPEGGGSVRPATSFGSVANRVSHFLDLNGPSMPIDTMCSSSLTAVHEACEHLRSGDCELALAGGVNLYLHPSTYVELSGSRMLSADGRCRSFGKGGNGFVPGEGVGCVLLKPLSRAVEDGDPIYAVIRGTAINHGGKTNGYTVPNPDAQRDVVCRALARAGLDARAVSYIEAHGTGTELGDPIEFAGLTQAFRSAGGEATVCALGSAKSNIGHLEAAAGIAGLTKVVLQMKHGMLAPTLHVEEANPHIDFAGSSFVLQRELSGWNPGEGRPRIAGVSSFGAGGANAHVVIEEWAPPTSPAVAHEGALPILLSAREPETLRVCADRLLAAVSAGNAKRVSIDLEATVRVELAGLLSVSPDELDVAEHFDAFGIDATCRIALRQALDARFAIALDQSAFRDLHSVKAVAAALRALISDDACVSSAGSLSLIDVAHTLQVGREAMECRLAIEASTLDELATGLLAYLAGHHEAPGIHTGNVTEHRDALTPLVGDRDFAETVSRWMERGRLGKVLSLWVKGLDIEWPPLAGARIVSLPAYPFHCQRYWLQAVPDGIASVVAGALANAGRAPGGEMLLERRRELERQLARLIPAQLRDVSEGGIVPARAAWRHAVAGLIAEIADPSCDVDADRAWSEWETYKREAFSTGGPVAQIKLAETMLRALPRILAGAEKATSVMFPAGAMHMVEDVYVEDPVAQRFNASLAAAARAFIDQRLLADPSAKLRILEIGAGTGATSEAVFQTLAPCKDAITEYCFTDVSRAFLIRAERRFRTVAPYLRTAILDIEKAPADQGMEIGAYDLVIAANVLHATREMRQTMANVRAAMRTDGLLLINEISTGTLFTHATFGLLDGWWRFQDPDVRMPGSPSLTPESWRTVLEGAGFRWVAGSPREECALGQQIVAATAKGAALQPVLQPSAASAGTSLRGRILGLLSETLNMEPAAIDVHKPFADYGLDSILGVELVHKLRRTLNVELEVTRLFDFSTVAQLEAFLRDQQPVTVTSHALQPARPRSAGREPIAIVGMSGRFAHSANVDQLWDHLLAGRDLVEPVSRFDLSPYYKDAAPDSYCRHGSFIDGVEQFDPVFFGISGLEATYMDPQQRLFLEEAWKTLESAGHAGADMEGRRCGVFVGASSGDYQELFRTQPPGQAFWGNTCSLIPARIAYYLDFKGPAVAVDTACSSSLVAVHLACQSLWSGDSEMALAGGVFVQSSPRFYRYANQARMLSPSGRCAAFGEAADGIVPGEAVAALLLRPLRDALADGDTILGVIVGTGTNQDGTTNGITAPSAVSQERLIRQVYDESKIDPATIGMVEAHGTGTVLGDPIEFAALTRAFGSYTDRRGYCALGSIKSNLGHTTTAAGVTGLVRILLALQHGQIPPTIHVGHGNPEIDSEDSPFFLNGEPRAWTALEGVPRRAAISSFGFSGTNAHMVIEEAPQQARASSAAPAWLVVLSARTAAQLRQQVERLLTHIEARPQAACADIGFTLFAGRKHFRHRLAVVVKGTGDLVIRLREWLAGGTATGVAVSELNERGHVEDAPNVLEPPLAAGDYMDRLAVAAGLYLAGKQLNPAEIFDRATCRRIPLPTYPLAAKRYWVDMVSPTPVPAVSLAPPETVAAIAEAPAGTLRIRLAPLAAPSAAVENESADLHRLPDADGVRRLEFEGILTDALARKIAGELAAAGADEAVRAVLLSATGDWDAASGVTLADDVVRAPLNCPLPVVAALRASGSGAALSIAMHCDFVVRAEDGRYSFDGELPSSRALVFEQRFGKAATGCEIVAAGRVEERALSLARQLAEAPRLSVVELKRHMRGEGRIVVAERMPLSEIAVSGPLFAGAGRRIDLDSPVIEMDAFDDGVVLLRLCERTHKNTFTEAFMQGVAEAFEKIGRSPHFRVVVLTGYDTYFACGGTREGLESLQRGATRFTDRKIYSLPLSCEIPVIAAMQGHAIGAGWSLGMFCDLQIFAAECVYHSNYMWYGFTPGAGATLIFPARLGNDLGREVLFTAREYKGRELAERGVPVTVLPSCEVLPHAMAIAHRMARAPRQQLVETKKRSTHEIASRLESTFERELAMHQKTFVSNTRVMERIEQAFPAPPVATTSRREQTRGDLVATLAEELMIDAAEIRDAAGFLELGLDSILAVTWIRRLNKQFGIELPATAVYAYPSVGALLDRILELAPELPPPVAAPVVRAARVEPPSRPTGIRRDAIAIVGASCCFPKSPDLDSYWENIRSGRDCIAEIPADRWEIARHYDPDPLAPGKSYSKWMGAIDDIALFDSHFFNITPREAELMDPQQRLFLQHAWHAIEDAAIDPARLAGTQCGVFAASGPSGYADLIDERNAYSLIGRSGSILAARIAYHLDLHGPCLSIDTACSSSLVAIAEACNSLVLGDSDLAVAGGASILIGPAMHVDTSKVSMLSKDGRCFSFDHRANGFVPGEGIGVLVLKRLEDAEHDGNPIHAVIRGWGVNQDGKTNGITAPNPLAQSRLLRGIYERFGIDPRSIGLVEAHGTGTPLGDPIEIEGLAGAFQRMSEVGASCAIGSVKSNIGHTLAAAGVAGVIKAMLAVARRELPPTIHFEKQNEHLALAGTPFYINTGLREWPAPGSGPRRAAVSSFGFSGTNAHAVIEEYASEWENRTGIGPSGVLAFPLSARTEEQLAEYVQSVARYVSARPKLDVAALAHTMQTGRTAFERRRVFFCRDRDGLLRALAGVAPEIPDDAESRTTYEVAGRWENGAEVEWPVHGGAELRRVHAPGYPFAPELHWVSRLEPAVRPTSSAARLLPLINRDASDPGGMRFTRILRGDEPFLGAHSLGAERLLPGLFYPEMARAAAELATDRHVRGVRNLVWGKPARINGKPRQLSVVFEADGGELLYRICADGEEKTPCHLGELILDDDRGFWPERLDMVRARHRLRGRDTHREDGETLARLDDMSGLADDVSYLDAIWRLLEVGSQDGPRFPYMLRSAIHDGPIAGGCIARIWHSRPGSLTVALYDDDGTPHLALDGLVTAPLADLTEIVLDQEPSE